MMMWFTKIGAQVVNDSITRVRSREGNGCDLVFYSGPKFWIRPCLLKNSSSLDIEVFRRVSHNHIFTAENSDWSSDDKILKWHCKSLMAGIPDPSLHMLVIQYIRCCLRGCGL
jgi:hypothetical protein